jgi:hypothetical protein
MAYPGDVVAANRYCTRDAQHAIIHLFRAKNGASPMSGSVTAACCSAGLSARDAGDGVRCPDRAFALFKGTCRRGI